MTAIYVGKPHAGLNYGRRGYALTAASRGPKKYFFTPEGERFTGRVIRHKDLYFPAKNLRRHCPKPISACTL